MTRPAAIQREREARARKRRDDGARESKSPFRQWNPGWLSAPGPHDHHRALPNIRQRMLPR